nr:MAG TPA: hypothetical protein [Caudoviricetes sp.]
MTVKANRSNCGEPHKKWAIRSQASIEEGSTTSLCERRQ